MLRRILQSCFFFYLASLAASCSSAEPVSGFDILLTPNSERFVEWATPIGHRTGSATITDSAILVGTNGLRSTRGDRDLDPVAGGTMLCLNRGDGDTLWQIDHPHEGDSVEFHGIRSFPTCNNNKVYYVDNNGKLICCDLQGMKDGIDDGRSDKELPFGGNGDVIWVLDFKKTLGVFAGNEILGNPVSTPLVVGDYVYCGTGNGSSWGRQGMSSRPFVPKPAAPSFVCVHKDTGELKWSSSLPGKDTVFAWGSPLITSDKKTVIFPGGDGRLYGFEPSTGKLQWRIDLNEKDSTKWTRNLRGSRTFFFSTPLLHKGMLFSGTSQDIYSTRRAPVIALDIAKLHEMPSEAMVWKFQPSEFWFSKSTPVVVGQSAYIYCEESQVVYEANSQTGEVVNSKLIEYSSRPKQFNALAYSEKHKVLIVSTETSLEFFQNDEKLEYSGRLSFEHQLKGDSSVYATILGACAIDGDLLCVPAAKHLFAINLASVLKDN